MLLQATLRPTDANSHQPDATSPGLPKNLVPTRRVGGGFAIHCIQAHILWNSELAIHTVLFTLHKCIKKNGFLEYIKHIFVARSYFSEKLIHYRMAQIECSNCTLILLVFILISICAYYFPEYSSQTFSPWDIWGFSCPATTHWLYPILFHKGSPDIQEWLYMEGSCRKEERAGSSLCMRAIELTFLMIQTTVFKFQNYQVKMVTFSSEPFSPFCPLYLCFLAL